MEGCRPIRRLLWDHPHRCRWDDGNGGESAAVDPDAPSHSGAMASSAASRWRGVLPAVPGGADRCRGRLDIGLENH